MLTDINDNHFLLYIFPIVVNNIIKSNNFEYLTKTDIINIMFVYLSNMVGDNHVEYEEDVIDYVCYDYFFTLFKAHDRRGEKTNKMCEMHWIVYYDDILKSYKYVFDGDGYTGGDEHVEDANATKYFEAYIYNKYAKYVESKNKKKEVNANER